MVEQGGGNLPVALAAWKKPTGVEEASPGSKSATLRDYTIPW